MNAPGLSWEEKPKMIKMVLKFIPDPDMHIYFEEGTKSDISHTSNKYSKDNNKYLKSYDPK